MVGVEGDFLQDIHGHLVVDHDLYNHEGLTEDGIAEAFIEFAKKENLSFFEPSPSVTPFEAVKYQQLMDGLEAAEVRLHEMMQAYRLDAEFAAHSETRWLERLQQKRSFLPLSHFLKYISSGHTPYKHDVHKGDIKFITVECVGSLSLDETKLKRIKQEHYDEEFQKNRIVKGAVVCTIKRRIGKAYPFLDEPIEPMAMNQDVAILILKANVRPGYLATYLSSRIGQSFCDRQKTEQMNPYISVANLSTLPTIVLNDNLQLIVEKIVKQAYSFLSDSKEFYQQAEDLLLSELGLKDWQPTEETFAVKSFAESFLSSGRFDAEYYQPKYDESINFIYSYRQGWENIRFACSLKDVNFIPKKEVTYQYIELSDIGNSGDIIDCSVQLGAELPSRARRKVNKGDVIISSIEGSLRKCALVTQAYSNSLCSTGFYVINSQKINAETLLVLFKSELVQNILKVNCSGTILTSISKDDFLNIPIPLIDKTVQLIIQKRILDSFDKREQSKQLLEIAKTGVERATETDEATATTWINQQLKDLNIDPATTV